MALGGLSFARSAFFGFVRSSGCAGWPAQHGSPRRVGRTASVRLAAFVALFVALGTAASEGADIGRLVGAELELRGALGANDQVELGALSANPDTPSWVRGRAVWAQFRELRPPLEAAQRARLASALNDAAPKFVARPCGSSESWGSARWRERP
jgi:hypothetical protein